VNQAKATAVPVTASIMSYYCQCWENIALPWTFLDKTPI